MSRLRPALALAALALPLAVLVAAAPAGGGAAGAAGGRAAVPGADLRVPPAAVDVGPLAAATPLRLDVVLQPRDPAALSAFVTAVSTPGSTLYHHYLTKGAFAARFGPTSAADSAVEAWLQSSGLSVGPVSADGLVLPVSGPAAAVSAAFDAPIDHLQLVTGRQAYAALGPPSLPAAEVSDVQSVVGLDDVATLSPALLHQSVPPGGSPARSLVPSGDGAQACTAAQAAAGGSDHTQSQLAAAYDFDPLYDQVRTGAGISVAIYELESYAPSDIATFEQCYGISSKVSAIQIDGGSGGAPAGSGEAAIDIENMIGLAPGVTVHVYEGPNGDIGPLDVWEAIASADADQVVSTSWGGCESSLGGLPDSEEPIFAEMAAQGQSVVAAAGDTGSEGCFSDQGGSNSMLQLAVNDPASQPDVTGVGGTTLPVQSTTVGQTVWNDCLDSAPTCAVDDPYLGAGGGGVSSLWPMPSWQSAAGDGTVTSLSDCPGSTVSICREVPDLSVDAAPSTGLVIYWAGDWVGGYGGTSGGAPLVGALLAIVDQGCAAPVGLANPALYQLGPGGLAFQDVTTGNNDFVDSHDGDYPSTAGFDLATGWGTPVGQVLAADLQPVGGCPAVTGLSLSSGPVVGGEILTVSGSDLEGAVSVHFGSRAAQILVDSAGSVEVVVPNGGSGSYFTSVTVTTANGTSAVVPAARFAYGQPPPNGGYWLVASDGGIFAFGDAGFYGSMGNRPLNKPIVGMAATADGGGYWLVASDGGIFAFGDAGFYGSMGNRPLNKPIVGMAATADGGGYWLVASDGGIFAFGDAEFYGSMGNRPLNEPIVGMAATADGGGYWLVASDGGIFAFGDAGFYGSMGNRPLNEPIVGMAATADGGGYWLVASDGGIFAFGDAGFYGSMGNRPLNEPIVGMAATSDLDGYWLVAADGGDFAFGTAGYFGSTGNMVLRAPVLGMAGD